MWSKTTGGWLMFKVVSAPPTQWELSHWPSSSSCSCHVITTIIMSSISSPLRCLTILGFWEHSGDWLRRRVMADWKQHFTGAACSTFIPHQPRESLVPALLTFHICCALKLQTVNIDSPHTLGLVIWWNKDKACTLPKTRKENQFTFHISSSEI